MLDHGLQSFTIFKLITAYKHQRKNAYLYYKYFYVLLYIDNRQWTIFYLHEHIYNKWLWH